MKVYRADGTLHKSWTRNGSKRYRACTYDEKGKLESLYDYDSTLVYVFPGTEIVAADKTRRLQRKLVPTNVMTARET